VAPPTEIWITFEKFENMVKYFECLAFFSRFRLLDSLRIICVSTCLYVFASVRVCVCGCVCVTDQQTVASSDHTTRIQTRLKQDVVGVVWCFQGFQNCILWVALGSQICARFASGVRPLEARVRTMKYVFYHHRKTHQRV
jgi:hypothetical protein